MSLSQNLLVLIKEIMFEVLKPHKRYIFSYKKERETRTLDLIFYWVNNLKTFYFYLGEGVGGVNEEISRGN